MYVHTNTTTCSATHSPNFKTPGLIFFVFLISCKTMQVYFILFFKIMSLSADFRG